MHENYELLSILLEQSIDDLLFLPHILFALFKAVALALDVDDSGVMKHTVKYG